MTLGNNSKEQLISIVQRIEKLEEEKSGIADDIRDVFAEAKGNGYSPKALREVIKIRKKSESERQEEESLLDSYLHALGMLPLFEKAESQ